MKAAVRCIIPIKSDVEDVADSVGFSVSDPCMWVVAITEEEEQDYLGVTLPTAQKVGANQVQKYAKWVEYNEELGRQAEVNNWGMLVRYSFSNDVFVRWIQENEGAANDACDEWIAYCEENTEGMKDASPSIHRDRRNRPSTERQRPAAKLFFSGGIGDEEVRRRSMGWGCRGTS